MAKSYNNVCIFQFVWSFPTMFTNIEYISLDNILQYYCSSYRTKAVNGYGNVHDFKIAICI